MILCNKKSSIYDVANAYTNYGNVLCKISETEGSSRPQKLLTLVELKARNFRKKKMSLFLVFSNLLLT